MELEEALRHAGRLDEGEVERRARDALPHYMFTDGDKRHRTGYCTCCQSQHIPIRADDSVPDWVRNDPYVDCDVECDAHHPEWQLGFRGPWQSFGPNGERFTGSGKHNDFGYCPVCGNLVQYKSFNLGRKSLSDRILLIRYRKSAIDERSLVMLGWLVICDWGKWDDYNERLPELYVDLREICVFTPGQGGQRFTKRVFNEIDWDAPPNKKGFMVVKRELAWTHNRQCVSGFDPWSGPFRQSGTFFMLDQETVEAALVGTPWERLYEAREDSELLDRIDFFHAVTKYPCLEYLEKLGLHRLSLSLFSDYGKKRLLNSRGKTAQAVLRVDGDFWGWIKGNRIDVSPALLEMYHIRKKTGWKIGNDALLWLSEKADPDELTEIGQLLPGGLLKKGIRYMQKKGVQPFLYRDHLNTMKQLSMDMTDTAMLFPAQFRQTHDELNARLKIVKNAKENLRVAARAQTLDGWSFSAMGLSIRPFLDADEIIREGNQLRHCVGTYVDRYANGGTVLLCLREDERPDKPWRTVEYSTNGKLSQCRGYRNQSPEDEQERIDEFLRMFERFRKEYKKVRVEPHPSATPTPSPARGRPENERKKKGRKAA